MFEWLLECCDVSVRKRIELSKGEALDIEKRVCDRVQRVLINGEILKGLLLSGMDVNLPSNILFVYVGIDVRYCLSKFVTYFIQYCSWI